MITVNKEDHVKTIFSLRPTPGLLLQLKFLHIQTYFCMLERIVKRSFAFPSFCVLFEIL